MTDPRRETGAERARSDRVMDALSGVDESGAARSGAGVLPKLGSREISRESSPRPNYGRHPRFINLL